MRRGSASSPSPASRAPRRPSCIRASRSARWRTDLKGLKLRTAGAWLAISKGLGAAPVTMPGGEVYATLERGAIDATEWGTL